MLHSRINCNFIVITHTSKIQTVVFKAIKFKSQIIPAQTTCKSLEVYTYENMLLYIPIYSQWASNLSNVPLEWRALWQVGFSLEPTAHVVISLS